MNVNCHTIIKSTSILSLYYEIIDLPTKYIQWKIINTPLHRILETLQVAISWSPLIYVTACQLCDNNLSYKAAPMWRLHKERCIVEFVKQSRNYTYLCQLYQNINSNKFNWNMCLIYVIFWPLCFCNIRGCFSSGDYVNNLLHIIIFSKSGIGLFIY